MRPINPINAGKIAMPAGAFLFSLLLTGLASAGTVNVPEDKPAISVEIPDSWKPEETDNGIACESPDKVATIFFEVTSAKGLDALIEENIDWLTKDQGVELDKASGDGKVLTVTYWITKKDQEKHVATIEKIFESVKRVGS
jgi:hypothetical protein